MPRRDRSHPSRITDEEMHDQLQARNTEDLLVAFQTAAFLLLLRGGSVEGLQAEIETAKANVDDYNEEP